MLKANKPLPRPLSPKARPRAHSTTSKEHDEPPPRARGCRVRVGAGGCSWSFGGVQAEFWLESAKQGMGKAGG